MLAELTRTQQELYFGSWKTATQTKAVGEKLNRIAQALEVTTDYLLDESGRSPVMPCSGRLLAAKFSQTRPDLPGKELTR